MAVVCGKSSAVCASVGVAVSTATAERLGGAADSAIVAGTDSKEGCISVASEDVSPGERTGSDDCGEVVSVASEDEFSEKA
jgi:hypothetical protein